MQGGEVRCFLTSFYPHAIVQCLASHSVLEGSLPYGAAFQWVWRTIMWEELVSPPAYNAIWKSLLLTHWIFVSDLLKIVFLCFVLSLSVCIFVSE